MLPRLFTLSLMLLVFPACSTIHSEVSVAAGEQFILGENSHEGFTARLENRGPNEAEVLKRIFGVETVIAILRPGDRAKVDFPADCVVFLRNRGPRATVVHVKLSGDTGLSMGYRQFGSSLDVGLAPK
jgi:hypothetical protein